MSESGKWEHLEVRLMFHPDTGRKLFWITVPPDGDLVVSEQQLVGVIAYLERAIERTRGIESKEDADKLRDEGKLNPELISLDLNDEKGGGN